MQFCLVEQFTFNKCCIEDEEEAKLPEIQWVGNWEIIREKVFEERHYISR